MIHTFLIIAACVGALYGAIAILMARIALSIRLAARAERREMQRLIATTKTIDGGQP